MIQQYSYNGEDYKAVMQFEGWKIGIINFSERFSRFDRLERHLLTDEAFILLSGDAVLYTETQKTVMQKNVVYNLPKGTWHHLTMSKNATVMVVENSETSNENTEIKFV